MEEKENAAAYELFIIIVERSIILKKKSIAKFRNVCAFFSTVAGLVTE